MSGSGLRGHERSERHSLNYSEKPGRERKGLARPCPSMLGAAEFDALAYCPAPGFRGLELEPATWEGIEDDHEDGTEVVGPADIRRRGR